LAVDFGTCFSSVAIWDGEGRPEVVVVAQQARFPSAVVLKDPATGELAVGRSATNAAVLHPDRVLRTPKRHLGVLEVALLGGTPVKVIDAVATVLDRVVGEARRQRGGTEPARVVMTHPARWGPERLGALGEAAAAVGLREPEFVSEPVAATFALPQAAVPVGGHVAVYDLGGGTFDTAVLRRAGEGFVVAGPVGGDEHFGGEDLDRRLFAHLGGLLSEVEPDLWTALEDPGEDLRWKRARAELYDGAREAKEALTDETAVEVHVREADRSLSVTRAEFERLVAPDLEATVALLADTVAAASLGPKDLAAIYLVGGAGQIPLISRLLHAHFGIAPTIYGDPKNTIVLGAALHQLPPAPVPVPAPADGDRHASLSRLRHLLALYRVRRLLEEERGTYLRQAEAFAAAAGTLAAQPTVGDTRFTETRGEDVVSEERERLLALAASAQRTVEEIDRALARLEAGTYGSCERCGERISVERLDALPRAPLCMACESAEVPAPAENGGEAPHPAAPVRREEVILTEVVWADGHDDRLYALHGSRTSPRLAVFGLPDMTLVSDVEVTGNAAHLTASSAGVLLWGEEGWHLLDRDGHRVWESEAETPPLPILNAALTSQAAWILRTGGFRAVTATYGGEEQTGIAHDLDLLRVDLRSGPSATWRIGDDVTWGFRMLQGNKLTPLDAAGRHGVAVISPGVNLRQHVKLFGEQATAYDITEHTDKGWTVFTDLMQVHLWEPSEGPPAC
jgi:RNA polymerase-binding transcription factor DksA